MSIREIMNYGAATKQHRNKVKAMPGAHLERATSTQVYF